MKVTTQVNCLKTYLR